MFPGFCGWPSASCADRQKSGRRWSASGWQATRAHVEALGAGGVCEAGKKAGRRNIHSNQSHQIEIHGNQLCPAAGTVWEAVCLLPVAWEIWWLLIRPQVCFDMVSHAYFLWSLPTFRLLDKLGMSAGVAKVQSHSASSGMERSCMHRALTTPTAMA